MLQVLSNPEKDQIHDYYLLRYKIYTREYKVNIPLTDRWDAKSEYIFIYDKDKLIGGCRITELSSSGLPMDDCFPNIFYSSFIQRKPKTVELSGLVISNRPDSEALFFKLFDAINTYCKVNNINRLSCITCTSQAKKMRIGTLKNNKLLAQAHTIKSITDLPGFGNPDIFCGFIEELVTIDFNFNPKATINQLLSNKIDNKNCDNTT